MRVRHLFSTLLMALLAVQMLGCASLEPRASEQADKAANAYLAFESSSLLAAPNNRDAGLFEGQIEASGAENRLRYSAVYLLHSDVLAQSLAVDANGADAVPAELGRQSLRQEFNLDLPPALGAPIRINMRNQHDLRWSFNGEARSDSQLAHLQWQPDHFALDLRWAPPVAAQVGRPPMDCFVQANLHLPTLPVAQAYDMVMDVSGQACHVHAPGRGIVGLAARSEALAWRWSGLLDSTVQVKRVMPAWQEFGAPEIEPAYELGLSQSLTQSNWKLGVDMAWRQIGQPANQDEAALPARWAMNFMLSRNLGNVAFKARWLRANDPLWFVPLASPVERERLSLLLDFSRWLAARLPDMDANMSASWEQVEDAQGVDDNRINWNVKLSW